MRTIMNTPGFKWPENVEIPSLLAELEEFHGTETVYHHYLIKQLIYTEGVRHLFQKGNCYWLSDLIAGALMNKELAKYERREVHVTAKDNKGSVVIYGIEGENKKPIWSQHLKYTDFPIPHFHMKFEQTIMGKGENEKLRDILFLFSED